MGKKRPLDIETRKRQVFSYLNHYYQKNGYAPSLSEMAEHFALTRQGVDYIVGKLIEDGKVEKTPSRYRNIRIKV